MLADARGSLPTQEPLNPGAVAQLVERLLCKEKVRSSNLLGSTARSAYHWMSASVAAGRGQEVIPRITSFRRLRVRVRARPRSWVDANEQTVNLNK